MKINKAFSLVFSVVLFSLLCSCAGSDVPYSEFKQVPTEGWSKQYTMNFAFSDSISAEPVDLSVCVRHDNYYAYSNLWLLLDYVSQGKVVESDTVNIPLSDKYGNWYGSGLGKLYQTTVDVKKDFDFKKIDEVIVWHYMRPDTVEHLSDLGLILTSKEK